MNKFYDEFHKKGKLQKRVITEQNFTYRNVIRLINSLRLTRDSLILDVGCGTGTIDFYLASKGHDVLGIDISERAIDLATMNAKNLNLDKNTNFLKMSFPGKAPRSKYDLVIFSEVLEHIANPILGITKIHGLLKKGGFLFVSTPLKEAPLNRWGVITAHDKKVGHIRRYSLSGLENVIKKSGFRIIRTEKHEGPLRNALFVFGPGSIIIHLANKLSFVSRVLAFIDNIGIALFGASQGMVLAEKI